MNIFSGRSATRARSVSARPHHDHGNCVAGCHAKGLSRKPVPLMPIVSEFLPLYFQPVHRKNLLSVFSTADTLGMEGNVIERRTSSAAIWNDARQESAPAPSTSQSLTSTPVGVPAYSNIFVTPPVDPEHRPPLVKMKETDDPDIQASKLSQIKDKHDGEIQNFVSVSNRPFLSPLLLHWIYSMIQKCEKL